MGTIHANNARQALSKLRTYLLMAREEVPAEVAADMIAETIQLVVHLELDKSGKRRVIQIAEVAGLEGGRVLTNDLYRLERGDLTATGVRPSWSNRHSDFGPHEPLSVGAVGNGSEPWKR